MKTILKSETVTIPDGITATIKKGYIVIKGPRGTLEKDLSHLPIDLKLDGKTITVERWFVSGKAPASIRTACSHIENLIVGVTKASSTRCDSSTLTSPSTSPSTRTLLRS